MRFEPSQERAEVWRIPLLSASSPSPRNTPRTAPTAMPSAALPCTRVRSAPFPEHGACSFLPSLQAQYRRGLALCQEAAQVRDAAFPEADPFQAAAALFQAKLVNFSRQVERRRAERGLLRELERFSSTVGARAALPQEPLPAGQPCKQPLLSRLDRGAAAGLPAVPSPGQARPGPGTALPAELLPQAVGGVRPGEAAGDEGSGAQDAEQPRAGSLGRGSAQVPGDPADPGGDAGRAAGGLGSASQRAGSLLQPPQLRVCSSLHGSPSLRSDRQPPAGGVGGTGSCGAAGAQCWGTGRAPGRRHSQPRAGCRAELPPAPLPAGG